MNEPQNDLQRFMALYESLGVRCLLAPDECGFAIKLTSPEGGYLFRGEEVTTHESFEGYTGFYSVIKFDGDGKYLSQGFYE